MSRTNLTRPVYKLMLVRESGSDYSLKTKASSSRAVAQFAKSLIPEGTPHEEVWVIGLDNKNQVMGSSRVSQGTLNQSLIHPREVFKSLVLMNSASFILVHNHPSGDPKPSPEDHEVTKRIKAAADIMAINLTDHVILGEEGKFHSYADSNWSM